MFTVLLEDEAKELGIRVDWDAEVELTSEMLAWMNAPTPASLSLKGRLLKPLILGPETIPAGHAVFMDGFGLYYIQS